ncbi:peptidylprolyl isomerase [Porticoccaceae bacterium]|nr:peptidylprolyl isomerase [Porticoccaceae bacterium]
MSLWKSFKLNIVTQLALSTAFSSAVLAEVVLLDRVAAIVDDNIVLQSELEQRTANIYRQIQQSGTEPPAVEIVKKQVLERLILERLQLNIGDKAGVRIADQEIDQTIARIAASKNISVEDYIAQIHASGETMAKIRQEIANEIIIMQVQQGTVMRGIEISGQELNNFLNSEEGKLVTSPDVLIGQILLSAPSTATVDELESIKNKLSGITQQLVEGADFKQLAIANSDDQSALEGGDLGWRKLAQLPLLFSETLENLELGEVSEPIRSGAGFHLLKLYERKGGGEELVEQHFARHILLMPNQIRDEQQTIELLEDIRTQIIDGADFSKLAKQHSKDPGSALKGGSLGWSTPGLFVPEFEQTMGSIALNEISAPFQSQFGWHILQVTERRMQDFSDDILRNRADNLLRQRKYSEELQVWQQKLRDEAYIEIKEI